MRYFRCPDKFFFLPMPGDKKKVVVLKPYSNASNMKQKKFLFLLFLSFLAGGRLMAAGDADVPSEVRQLTDSLKQVYAPDGRVALFDVDCAVADKNLMLRGVTTSPQARDALLHELSALGYRCMDCLRVLPDTLELGEETFGILDLSVANLHRSPDFASEMVTQGLLGMPVRVLQHDGWYRIQTPDRYIAWVHPAAVHRVTRSGLEDWNRAEKIVVTAHYGFVYTRPAEGAQTVSDVVAGNRLKWEGTKGAFYHVSYPDGRTGYIRKSIARPETEWRRSLKTDAASLIATAYTLMGVPYLWAGTSSKGVDCSGFVRTVLFMHDMIIPRDASQQARVGQRIDIAPDFANLQPGDLVFFGRKGTADRPDRVVHVAIYIGNKRFIHSQGDVHVSSFNPADPAFDEFNLNRLLFATRILPYIGRQPALDTTASNDFYQ